MSALLWFGVDGCRGGWARAVIGGYGIATSLELYPALSDVSRDSGSFELGLIDIPIGLPSLAMREPRQCDAAARKVLGPRASSVFSPPCREALQAACYEAGCQTNLGILGRKLSKQTWNLIPKMREADELFSAHPAVQEKIREGHPELAFLFLAAKLGLPVPLSPKRGRPGIEIRMRALASYCPQLDRRLKEARGRFSSAQVSLDDWLDALALAVLARFVSRREVTSLPAGGVPRDKKGLRMEVFGVASGAPEA